MEGVALDSQQSVLIVDSSEETREVLQTALERRGLRTFSASCPAGAGIRPAASSGPDRPGPRNRGAGGGAGAEPVRPVCRALADRTAPGWSCWAAFVVGNPPPDGEFVAKPYHYGPLIRKIEELLVGRRG